MKTNTSWYLLGADQQPRGPVREEELEDLVLSGQLPESTLIWQQGMEEWLPVDAVFERVAVPDEAAAVPPPLPEPLRSDAALPVDDPAGAPEIAEASLACAAQGTLPPPLPAAHRTASVPPAEAVPDEAEPAALRGAGAGRSLGGWVIFFAVLLCLHTVVLAAQLVLNVLFLCRFQPLMSMTRSASIWVPGYIFDALALSSLVGLGAATLWHLFARHRRTVLLMLFFYGLNVGLLVVSYWMWCFLAPPKSFGATTEVQLISALLWALVVASYFLVSRRVKETFVRGGTEEGAAAAEQRRQRMRTTRKAILVTTLCGAILAQLQAYIWPTRGVNLRQGSWQQVTLTSEPCLVKITGPAAAVTAALATMAKSPLWQTYCQAARQAGVARPIAFSLFCIRSPMGDFTAARSDDIRSGSVLLKLHQTDPVWDSTYPSIELCRVPIPLDAQYHGVRRIGPMEVALQRAEDLACASLTPEMFDRAAIIMAARDPRPGLGPTLVPMALECLDKQLYESETAGILYRHGATYPEPIRERFRRAPATVSPILVYILLQRRDPSEEDLALVLALEKPSPEMRQSLLNAMLKDNGALMKACTPESRARAIAEIGGLVADLRNEMRARGLIQFAACLTPPEKAQFAELYATAVRQLDGRPAPAGEGLAAADRTRQERAGLLTWSLASLGAPAGPALARCLVHPVPPVRAAAEYYLHQAWRDASAPPPGWVIQAVTELLSSDDVEQRNTAAALLKKLGPAPAVERVPPVLRYPPRLTTGDR
jgi:hypothetical protein